MAAELRPPRALLVEDVPESALACIRMLEDEGYAVTAATHGRRVVELVRVEMPELLIMDLEVAGLDGFEACAQIRQFSDAYIVVVCAPGRASDIIEAFLVGADHVVTRPYSPLELAARIHAMRRRANRRSHLDDVGGARLRVDPDVREVVLDGAPVDLTRIEFDLLETLARHPRQIFTRRQLLESVWGDNGYGDDHVIDVHVGNLRRKLGESAAAQRHVRTIRGVGYRFEAA
jgi:DNA-binding response OmpR family regulator